MKVWCKTQVISLASNAFAGPSNGKPKDSCIVVGSQNKIISIRLSIKSYNTTTDYRLTDNISNIFSRHVDQGKITIRLYNPATDIMLSQTDAVLLKSFHSVLKMIQSNKEVPKSLLSNTQKKVKAEDNRFQRKLCIKERHAYPLGQNFPVYLTSLSCSSLSLRKFDNRIITLKKLSSLILSDNLIEELPPALCDMGLSYLDLSGNKISQFVRVGFECSLSQTLQTLILSRNKLDTIHSDFWNLTRLIHLSLDRNQLVFLPAGIDRVRQLQSLRLNGNQLSFMPYGITCLELDSVDLTGNDWKLAPFQPAEKGVGTLQDIAMEIVKNSRYNNVKPGDVPLSLYFELNTFSNCFICRRWSSRSASRICVPMPMATIVKGSITRDYRSPPSMVAYLCSSQCHSTYRSGGSFHPHRSRT